jgi:hypothetical protein
MMKTRTVAILLLALGSAKLIHAQQTPMPYAEDIIAKMLEHNSLRDKSGAGYTGSRHYLLQNQKFDKRAEMVVSVKCGPDGTKHFEVVSEDGWKSANKHVIRKMLESETETSRPEIRPSTSVSSDNYRFQLVGSDSLEGRRVYVIQVLPKREDKYLFEGRVWVDAEDFAMVRAEGKPAKNPSFWTRSVYFVQQYQKSGMFWFPLSTKSVTEARIFGKTEVSISYFDYQANSPAQCSASAESTMNQVEVNYVHQ